VALAYGTQAQAANELADRITAAGGAAIAIGADLASPDGAGQLIKRAEQELGPIEVLVSTPAAVRSARWKT
jgi:3-oxoacyl-[acyl-carrier protein] reductase